MHILADADGALLAVDDFVGGNASKRCATVVGTFGIVLPHRPIHHVEGESLREGVDDGVALFLLIDELALVWRAHVETAPIGAHALLVVVFVSLHQLADGDLVQFDFHNLSVWLYDSGSSAANDKVVSGWL